MQVQTPEVYAVTTNDYLRAGNFEQALALLLSKEAQGLELTYLEHYNFGICLSKLGQDEEAISHYLICISLNPTYENAYTNIANIYIRKNQLRSASSLMARLCKLNSKYTEKYVSILFNLSKYKLIMNLIDKNFEKIIMSNPIKYFYSYACVESNFPEKAEPIISQLPLSDDVYRMRSRIAYKTDNPKKIIPNLLKIKNPDGNTYLALGIFELAVNQDKKAAVSNFEKALDCDVAKYVALYQLSRVTDGNEKISTLIGKALSFQNEPNLSISNKAAIQFSLFNLYDKMQECDLAAVALREANVIFSNHSHFNSQANKEMVQGILARDKFVSDAPLKELNKGILHIFGLPRSGTSILENLLSRNFNVSAKGELNVLGKAILIDRKKHGKAQHHQSAVYDCYHSVLGDDAARYIIDKQPFNFYYFGEMVNRIENYKAIVIQKTKREIAWSLYKQWFESEGLNWVYRFRDIEAFIADYDNLITYWRQKYPDNILLIDYEDLVNNTDVVIKLVSQFIDLPAKKQSRKNKYMKKTASNAQLIDGVNTKYLKSSERYQSYFPELSMFDAS